ncbi:MAG: VOC family protein [Solirubrobacteraceae bacterium]
MSASAEAPSLARPGGVSYLHIPTSDPRSTAAFYEETFGWSIRDANTDSPAFTDGTGHVIGHFVTDQSVAGESGVRPYIYVEDARRTAERIAANGGVILKEPFAEGHLTVAIFADPAGNVLGVWQFGSSS